MTHPSRSARGRLAEAVLTARTPGKRPRVSLGLGDGAAVTLVCIDGLAGAGKTTLAAQLSEDLAAAGRSVAVVHMDDLYEGWGGLLDVHEKVRSIVEALAVGAPVSYRRYDWIRAELAEEVELGPVDVVILEGCGSAPPLVDEAATLTIFVTAPDDLRLARGLSRDGDGLREQWLAFMRDERTLVLRDGADVRADVVLDESGALLRWGAVNV